MDDINPDRAILLLAYGNLSRGDDALAPLLLDRIEKQYSSRAGDIYLKYCQDYQIQVEHVTDMHNCERVILMDASQSLQQPYVFYAVEEQPVSCYTTHGMDASNLLHIYRQVYQQSPPDTYMLAIQGTNFELGEPLSSRAQHNLKQAFSFISAQLQLISSDLSASFDLTSDLNKR